MDENVTFICFTTDEQNENLLYLKRVLKDDLVVVTGKKEDWTWDFLPKTSGILNYLVNNETNENICFLDAHDTSFMTDVESAKRVISLCCKSYNILMNGEINCYPSKEYCKLYKSDGIFKYLNCGVFCGKKDFVVKFLTDLEHGIKSTGNIDQDVSHVLYLEALAGNKDYLIKIDDECMVFQTMFGVDPSTVERNRNLVTKTNPIIVHGNGQSQFKHLRYE